MDSYRRASTIELHDIAVIIALDGKAGWSDAEGYPESLIFEVDTEESLDSCRGIAISQLPIIVKDFDEIQAAVEGPSLLQIRLVVRKNGKERMREITYCGRFSIFWNTETNLKVVK